MRLSSDELTRLAAFVEHLESISAEHGIEIAADRGTMVSVDGQTVYDIELVNRTPATPNGEARVAAYAIESAG